MNGSNEELLRKYQGGSFQAFDAFYRKNRRIIFCFILSKVGNESIAEDVFQETFLRLHKYILKYNPEKSALNWVYTIARNTALTHLSRTVSHSEFLDDTSESKQLSPSELLSVREELSLLLEGVSDEEKKILGDRFLEGKSFQELAREQKLTTENARQKVSRLVRKLRSQRAK